jgi:hypothetical protein
MEKEKENHLELLRSCLRNYNGRSTHTSDDLHNRSNRVIMYLRFLLNG